MIFSPKVVPPVFWIRMRCTIVLGSRRRRAALCRVLAGALAFGFASGALLAMCAAAVGAPLAAVAFAALRGGGRRRAPLRAGAPGLGPRLRLPGPKAGRREGRRGSQAGLAAAVRGLCLHRVQVRPLPPELREVRLLLHLWRDALVHNHSDDYRSGGVQADKLQEARAGQEAAGQLRQEQRPRREQAEGDGLEGRGLQHARGAARRGQGGREEEERGGGRVPRRRAQAAEHAGVLRGLRARLVRAGAALSSSTGNY
mmetsp:Transcript_106561/g.333324  ORF Transcript_106561/g.333324 Transcript_106561/m.333324 type:complete len:256 (-) Transcript_106561:10-777(-)